MLASKPASTPVRSSKFTPRVPTVPLLVHFSALLPPFNSLPDSPNFLIFIPHFDFPSSLLHPCPNSQQVEAKAKTQDDPQDVWSQTIFDDRCRVRVRRGRGVYLLMPVPLRASFLISHKLLHMAEGFDKCPQSPTTIRAL